MKRSRRVLGLVLVAVFAAAWLAWRSGSGDAPPPVIAADTAPAPAAEDAPREALGSTGVAAAGERSAVAAPSAEAEAPLVVPDELAHPHLYVLVVRTLDAEGLPVRGASLSLAPVNAELNEVRALGEQDGWTTIAWRGKQPEMDVDVNVGRDFGGAKRLHLCAGTPHETALLADGNTSGARRMSFRLARITASDSEGSFTLEAVSDDPPVMERFPHPHARFGSRMLELPPAPSPASAPVLGAVTERDLVELKGDVQVMLERRFASGIPVLSFFGAEAVAEESSDARSTVTVLVLDEAGKPVPNATVALGRELDGADLRATTDPDGVAVLEGVLGGWWEARAGGGMEGLARERLFVEAPNALSRTLQLSRGACVRGRVVDADGQPRSDVRVRYESMPDALASASAVRVSLETRGGEELTERGDPAARTPGVLRAPWIDEVVPREDGSFEIPNLPPGLGRLIVAAADSSAGASLLVEEGVLPSDEPRVLRLPETPGGLSLRLTFPASGAPPPEGLGVRAISLATGRGVEFERHHGEPGTARFQSPALAAGAYRVEVGARASGRHDLGVQLVVEAGVTDLGDFALPAPGRLELEGSSDRQATFYLRRADLDLRVEPRETPAGGSVLLPAGEYWAFWTDAEGHEHRSGFALEAGGTARLRLE